MKQVADYLEQVDEVISRGTYKDTWESLRNINEPEWYRNAKFGIFIHWGVYSVPAYDNEWYPRNMYIQGSDVYKHHVETYGPPKEFGYKDFIPLFKAEKFNPDEWAELFEASGAKYFMPVAEHHDGFQMYDSGLSEFNAAKMGPCRDVLGELKEAGEKRGLVFCASNHRAENYWFMCGGRDFDSGIQDIDFAEPYGYACKLFEPDDMHEVTFNIQAEGPSQEHLENWLARNCELVDRYQPKVVWFDWWIANGAFKPYLQKFAAYYYNRALEWGVEVAINYKEGAYPPGTAILDFERGQLADINPRLWQNDTSVAKHSWSYTVNNEYKTPESLVCDLVDIVSKNGLLLLNIGPKADGTIPDEDARILRSIGQWLSVNGEAIFDTTYWNTFGEGPTKVAEGSFTDVNRSSYTSEDIRFTFKAPYLYATVLHWPENSEVLIKSLATSKFFFREKGSEVFKGEIESIDVLGYDFDATYDRTEEGLRVKVEGKIETAYPVCLKIKTI